MREVKGAWKRAVFRQGKPRYIGPNYLSDDDADKGALSVTFRVAIPAAGRYVVWMSYVDGETWSDSVPVAGHSDGTTSVTVDQTKKPTSGFFVPIAVYRFEAGSTAVITVSHAGTKGKVIVDAVEFEPVKN